MSDDPLIRHAQKCVLGLPHILSDDKSHYEALGRFIAAYSTVEGIVHTLTRKLTALPDDKARILLNKMTLGEIVDRLRQILSLDKIPEADEIEACLTQLAAISVQRHKLVHRGATYFAGAFIVSNSATAKSAALFQMDQFDVGLLADMTSDCGKIFLRLAFIVDPANAGASYLASLRKQPWRYKHVPPKKSRKTKKS